MNNDVNFFIEELAKANSLLRSAYSIASRNGADTNWESFRNQVGKLLNDEHEILQGYWTDKAAEISKFLVVDERTI
jgi:hypothetical protein